MRSDLEMPSGKLSSQAGHAYADTLNKCLELNPDRYHNYRNPSKGGSKVTLKAKNENQLITAFNKARELGLPCAIIVDREHVLPPHFNGDPIITALGIGACTKEEVRSVVKKFQCL